MLSVAPTLSVAHARSEWEANSTPAYRVRRQLRHEVIDEFRMYGDAIAILQWTNICTISKIETLRPRVGAATALLKFLKSLADRYQITLLGIATAYRPDEQTSEIEFLSQEELQSWYERHAFQLHKARTGCIEIWYPKTPYAAQSSSAADAKDAPLR